MFGCCSVCQSSDKPKLSHPGPASPGHYAPSIALAGGSSSSTSLPPPLSSGGAAAAGNHLGSGAADGSSATGVCNGSGALLLGGSSSASGADPGASGEEILPYRRTILRGRTKLLVDGCESTSPGPRGKVSALSFASDGGTGGSLAVDDSDPMQPAMKQNPCTVMRSFTRKFASDSGNRSPGFDGSQGMQSMGLGPCESVPIRGKIRRRDSQMTFASNDQVIVIFDWDDTLFPTSYIQDDLQLRWNLPLRQQKQVPPGELRLIEEKLQECQNHVAETLRLSCARGHTVIVTLAKTGWVDLSCRNFYPMIGSLLAELKIPIVYAQERSTKEQMTYNKAAFESDEDQERFWGLVKGRAISDEIEKFYQQYEGQSWKNIISIGDSCFERYGLLAATSAYMRGEALGEANAAPMSTAEDNLWQSVDNGHVKKVRVKAVKLVDRPEIEELIIELEMISKWMDQMVELDSGFDLDLDILEDEAQVGVIDAVLRGALPASSLPKPGGPF